MELHISSIFFESWCNAIGINSIKICAISELKSKRKSLLALTCLHTRTSHLSQLSSSVPANCERIVTLLGASPTSQIPPHLPRI